MDTTNLEKLPLKELKEMLQDTYDVPEKVLNQLTRKKQAASMIVELQTKEANFELDDVNLDNINISTGSVEFLKDDDIPDTTDPKWHDYVMSQFIDDEMVDNKYPTVDGLRRVVEKLLGPIITSRPFMVFPAENENSPGRVTVEWEIEIQNINWETPRRYGDVASCYPGQFTQKGLKEEYAIYNTEVAATRAEARCLRKALQLRKAVAAEEMVGNHHEAEVMTGGDESVRMQHASILRSARVGVDIALLVKTQTGKECLEDLTYSEAEGLVQLSNQYLYDPSTIPDEIKR